MSFTFELMLPFPDSGVPLCIKRDQCETREQGPLPRPEIERSSGPAGNNTVEEMMLCVEETEEIQCTQPSGFGEIWRSLSPVGLEAFEPWRRFRGIGPHHRN
jgi:hypothetical protein